MALIQVLGTGCAKCGHLMKSAEEAAGRLNNDDLVEKVDDIMKILEFAPNALPALAVDGNVVFSGSLPSVSEICEVLKSASNKESSQ